MKKGPIVIINVNFSTTFMILSLQNIIQSYLHVILLEGQVFNKSKSEIFMGRLNSLKSYE